MSPVHRRYLLLEQGVGAAVFNFVVNAAIAWLMFRTQDEVPLWGQQSIAGDTIGTSLLLPLITCLVVTPMARRHVRAGRVAALEAQRVPGWLPRGTAARAVVLGIVCMVAIAPLTLLGVALLHVAPLGMWKFVLFKASFAAAEALLVTPLIALWAIADADDVPANALRVAR